MAIFSEANPMIDSLFDSSMFLVAFDLVDNLSSSSGYFSSSDFKAFARKRQTFLTTDGL